MIVKLYNLLITVAGLALIWLATGTWQMYVVGCAGVFVIGALRISPKHYRVTVKLSKQIVEMYRFIDKIGDEVDWAWTPNGEHERVKKTAILREIDRTLPKFIKNGHKCDEKCEAKNESTNRHKFG